MNPYQAPVVSSPIPDTSKIGKRLAVTGAFLQLCPLIAVAATVISMSKPFSTPGNTGADVGALAGHIGEILVVTTIGLIGSILGLSLFFLALLKFRYRAPWCFWFLVIYGILCLAGFPIGTLIGIGVLIYAGNKCAEFLPLQVTVESVEGNILP